MLSKLLKHELRATGRVLLPIYVLLAVSTGLFCLSIHIGTDVTSTALSIFRGLVGFVFAVTVIGAGIVTLALMVYRFYKNYMTEEGYLMFTLPVSTGALIWSKLIVALLWTAVTGLVTLLAISLAAVSSPFLAESLPDLRAMWQYLLGQISGGQIAAFIAEFVVLFVLSAMGSYLMFYAAIALGHSFSNHKVLLSVVFYLAFALGMQTVASFGGVYGIIAAVESGFFAGNPQVWLHQLSLGGIVGTFLIAAIFYVVTHLMLKKRLNLQ